MYSRQGVDQLQKVIDTIKTNPEDRRIILCAWNQKIFLSYPATLPLCHALCHFYVVNHELSCSCTRGQETGAWVCPSTLPAMPCSPTWSHTSQAWSQVTLYTLWEMHTFTWITLSCWKCSFRENQGLSQSSKSLEKLRKSDFKAEDFQIEGYSPHPTIKMEMAV